MSRIGNKDNESFLIPLSQASISFFEILKKQKKNNSDMFGYDYQNS
jgi:hypothetical protein